MLTPKLNISDIDSKNQFAKMRVNKVKNLLSTDVSSALEFLVDVNNVPEYITTAWFIKMTAKWFTLMSSRHCSVALGKLHIEKYNENVDFLNEFLELFKNLTVGQKQQFKPVQKGIMITTISILQLTNYLLEEKAFQFLLPVAWHKHCVENLFSVIKSKNPVLNALQFENNLKLISVSLYMQPVIQSNYEEDNGNYLTGFLELLEKKEKDNYLISDKNDTTNNNSNDNSEINICFKEIPILNNIEMNILYNVAGYIINSI